MRFMRGEAKKGKGRISLTKQASRTGRLFVLPFYIGILLFFAKPLVETLIWAFGEVSIEVGGYQVNFVGLENIRYIFQEDLNYSMNLVNSIRDLLWQTPMIVLISLFIAIILNSKFHGRTFVRAVFFLPVIVVTGTITLIIQSDTAASGVLSGNVVASGTIEYSQGLQDILVQAGLSSQIVNAFTTVSDAMFNLLWKTGVQMIIFLAGLQGISPSLYEASAIEGATAWENFFKITLPMLAPIILLNLVYTIVDSFTDAANSVMQQVSAAAGSIRMGLASAMSWTYFLIIAVILALVALVYRRMTRNTA